MFGWIKRAAEARTKSYLNSKDFTNVMERSVKDYMSSPEFSKMVIDICEDKINTAPVSSKLKQKMLMHFRVEYKKGERPILKCFEEASRITE